MRIGKSQRGRPWGRIESLERREMMTLEPTFLGEFEICAPRSAEVEFRGETSYYLQTETKRDGSCGTADQESVIRTDGTPEGTFVVGRDVNYTLDFESFFVLNDTIYYEMSDGRDAQVLFGTDATADSAVQLSYALGETPVEFDGGLYFTTSWGRHLWRSDGVELTSIENFGSHQIDQIRQVGDQLVFSMLAFDSIWASDGTRFGTHELFELGVDPREVSLSPAFWREDSGVYVFRYFEQISPEGESPRLSLTFANYDPITGASSMESLEIGGRHLSHAFYADQHQAVLSFSNTVDGEYQISEWYTDGTVEGTHLLAQSGRPPRRFDSRGGGAWRDDMIYVYFPENGSHVLREVDATSSRVLLRAESPIESINVIPGAQLMLVETATATRTRLWLVDEVGAIEIGNSVGPPLDIAQLNGQYYFTAGTTIWRTDGTREGTEIVDEGTSHVYFTDHAVYYEKEGNIWRTRGGFESRERVHDTPLGQAVGAGDFLVFGTDEQFVANDNLGSLVRAEDYLGVSLGEVGLELSNGRALIFEKQNQLGLTEYWHTDGTPTGTYPIGVVSPRREYHESDRFCGFPKRLTEAGDYVLFSVNTCNAKGTWAMSLHPEPVTPLLADVRRELNVGDSNDVALADFDNDGDLDAYFIRDIADEIWWNDGAGFYEDSGIRFETMGTNDVELADVDLDGDVDVVVAAVGGNRVFLAEDDGSYQEVPLEREDGVVSVDVSAGDVTGDQRLDFYFANQSETGGAAEDNLVLSRDSVWRTSTGYGVQISYSSAFADFDEDGDLDLVVSNDAENGGYFYENLGFPGSRLQRESSLWADSGVLDAIQLHSNPAPDEYPGNVGLIGLGAGPGTVYPTSSRCCSRTWGNQLGDLPQNDFAIGDFDSDGDSDLFFAAAGDHGNSLWLNTNGQFQFWQSNLDTGVETRAVAAGDVDGDGDTDVMAVTEDGSSRIYLNLSADTLGDLDLDGRLTDADVALLRSNYAARDAIYADGDLDNDQVVTFEDYLLLSQQFANRASLVSG